MTRDLAGKPNAADATQEYRGPIDVVLDETPYTDANVSPSLAPVALQDEDTTGDLFADLDEPPPPRKGPPRWAYAVIGGVMGVSYLVIALAVGSRAASNSESVDRGVDIARANEVGRSATTPAAPESKPAAKQPEIEQLTEAPAAKTTGSITSPKWAKDRRVFFDGKDIGLSGKLEVACGQHKVKIGPSGKMRWVTVPCGGEVMVFP